MERVHLRAYGDGAAHRRPHPRRCPGILIFDIAGSQVYDATIQARGVIIKPA